MRTAVTSVINKIGSTTTITPYTISSSDSGYSGQVETGGTAVSEKAVPFEEFKTLITRGNCGNGKIGDLETGGFQLAFKSTAVFDISGSTKYKITYNSEDYDITQTKRYVIEDVLVAWIITMSKRLD